jgi:signal transduction histidine kinase
LISNSIKYRQPEIEPIIEVKTFDRGELVEIVVSDNGLGMNLPQIQSSLFGLYKRFHHHIEGKGLGLYMIKTQTEAMGGKIEVSSKVNEGTTFSVFLRK